MNTRAFRNAAGWVGATTLRAMGSVERAHRAAMEGNCTLGLCFHNPPRHLFASVIKWFRDRQYRFLSVLEIEDHFETGVPLPKRSAWISFDDAWLGNLTEVVPLIRDWNLPITVFVPTEEVRRGTFWFSQALRNPHLLPEPFRKHVMHLWRVPESTRKNVMDRFFEISPPMSREVMSIAEIGELARMPQVTIGSHTERHAILPNCGEAELWDEILNSKKDLEDWTGRSIRVFSYPNGDFDVRTWRVLAQAGYSLAFTTQSRPITIAESPYYLPRLSVMDDGSITENICHALGLWPPMASLLKREGKTVPTKHRLVASNSELLDR